MDAILAALAALAMAGAQTVTSQAFQDAYATLKRLLQKRFENKPDAEKALKEYEHDPKTWEDRLRMVLKQEHVDQDPEIIKAATTVVQISMESIKSKRRQRIVLLILVVMVVLGSGGYAAFQYFHSSPTSIGVTTIGGESIGISDGSFAFDTTLTDGSLKSQAAQAYRQNNIDQAKSLLNQAIGMNSNDAEALIYQEDLKVVNSGKPYVTIVVAIMLSGDNIGVGREDLQGTYVAQKEFNDGSKLTGGVQVRLLIANIGSKTDYVSNVTSQIVQLARNDTTFVGVMGLPMSRYSVAGIDALSSAHIPLVSQSSMDMLAKKPYFFRVVPSDTQQGEVGARYAINTLHAKNVVLFDDQHDAYSQDLAQDFLQEFRNDGGQLAIEERYTVGHPESLPSELQDALNKNPDLIYFSGYPTDASTLLSNPLPSDLPVLGGSALYELEGYSKTAHASGFSHLHFTSSAYPDEWNILGYGNQKPAFFSEYPAYFDPNNLHQNDPHPYGFTRADNDVITSYDTILAMLSGCEMVLRSGKPSITPDDLNLELKQLNGTNAIQGVSGQIAFGPKNGNPINKAIIMLHVDSQGYIQMDPRIILDGQFIKQPSS
ncbi:MAG TPA: ABC transporter substrate-binding protein [Ktedonobacteraceae bacterium]|nr:ABC transporter substrate-binding protein [Ktedonobacteraceae bacterium]